MEFKKIDRTKLKKVSNYAKITGFSVQHVYKLAKENKIKMVEIDTVKFIQLN